MIQIYPDRQHRKGHADRQSHPLLTFAFCLLTFDLFFCQFLRRLKESLGKRQRPLLLHFAFCILPFALFFCLMSSVAVLSSAQEPPYASINHSAVNYNGPGRDSGHDLVGSEIRLGLLAPLAGPRQAEGEAMQRAAQMAVDEENANSLPGGRRFALVIRDETGPWGQASAQIVHLVFDDQAVALITSSEGDAAHLAEQVGNKIGVPILTLSTDSTTTQINLPWIFRLGPSDAGQAQAFTRDIYQKRGLQRVLLLSQNDRDGRLGGEAFAQAAGELTAIAPTQMVVDPEKLSAGTMGKEISSAQAVVIWTDAPTARRLAARVREVQPGVPLYLCRKAVEGDSNIANQPVWPVGSNRNADAWVAAAPENGKTRDEFNQRYQQRFGVKPGLGAREAYDAVRILAAGLRQSGINRARLRDALAEVSNFTGASGMISFDHAGNDLTAVTLLKLE